MQSCIKHPNYIEIIVYQRFYSITTTLKKYHNSLQNKLMQSHIHSLFGGLYLFLLHVTGDLQNHTVA